MRALGIDPGSRRIGLSLSDEDRTLASPLDTVERTGGDAHVRAVAEVVRERAVTTVVVGLPLRTDGTEGPEAKRARAFGSALERATEGAEVVYWDERFTTAQADRALADAGKGGRARRAVIDKAAATVLLQSWLDAQRPDDGEP